MIKKKITGTFVSLWVRPGSYRIDTSLRPFVPNLFFFWYLFKANLCEFKRIYEKKNWFTSENSKYSKKWTMTCRWNSKLQSTYIIIICILNVFSFNSWWIGQLTCGKEAQNLGRSHQANGVRAVNTRAPVRTDASSTANERTAIMNVPSGTLVLAVDG